MLQMIEKDSKMSFAAGVAELVDARDLKSREERSSYRFDPGRRQISLIDAYWVSVYKAFLFCKI